MDDKLQGWYGFTQNGEVIYLGLHRSIEHADDTLNGESCIWLWSDEALLELVTRAATLRITAERELQAALTQQVVAAARVLATCITVNHDNDYCIVDREGGDPVLDLQTALAEYNAFIDARV